MKTLTLLLFLAAPALAEPIHIVSWNVESGGNDPAIIAEQLVALDRADIYCLQEVSYPNIPRYAFGIRNAHDKGFRFISTNTGAGDRLVVVYNSNRFDLLESRELFKHGEYVLNSWRHRSPLVLVLKDRQTGREFNVMTVHLARGDKSARLEQATGLREWAREQDRPTIAIGDFNFDYSYRTDTGNPAFDAFTKGDVWRWVRPPEDVDSNWSDRNGDGVDDYPDSVLDFAFVSGEGLGVASAQVIVRDGDFPDDGRTSDHRPVRFVLE